MEILEKGTIPKKPKYIFRCHTCNSKLKCDKEDIGNTGVFRYFTCPVCNNRNYVEDYDLECARVFETEV